MKKIYLSIIAIALVGFCKVSTAQITVNFQVDMNAYIAASNTVNAAGMRVGGTFLGNSATNNSTPMLDWSPDDATSAMTDLGGNIWGITVTFPSSRIDSLLQFKFVNGTWYPTGTNEDANGDTSLVHGGCSPATGAQANNRLFTVPSISGQTYKWCYDSCKQCNGADPLISGVQQVDRKISVFTLAPNPAVNSQSTLIYSVTETSPVNVSLYNVLGQSVKTYVNTVRPSGVYNQTIDLKGISSGVYFIQLTSGNQVVSKKIVL